MEWVPGACLPHGAGGPILAPPSVLPHSGPYGVVRGASHPASQARSEGDRDRAADIRAGAWRRRTAGALEGNSSDL